MTTPESVTVGDYCEAIHAENPEELQVGEHGYKYRLVENRVMPPFVTPRSYALSRSLPTRSSDICFVSYPKSGTTWLSYIIVLLTNTRGPTLESSFHWLESSWTQPTTAAELDSAPAPRLFKSHMPYDMALGGVPHENACRYIYVARNPKDVCASYYCFEGGKSWSGFYRGDWAHWLGMFESGKAHRGDWFEHVLGWWEHRAAENVLFLTYEEMKRDTRGALEAIACFLGVVVEGERMDEIERMVGFKEMRGNEFSAMRGVREFGRFFRKGEIGSWKEYFTVAQSERFDDMYRAKMGGSGLDFTFE